MHVRPGTPLTSRSVPHHGRLPYFLCFFALAVVGAALCIAAAYTVAPAARHRAVRVTVIVVACLTLYLFFIHRRSELLFALIAAFVTEFFIRRHDLRSTPNT
jgi:hypothetical protein